MNCCDSDGGEQKIILNMIPALAVGHSACTAQQWEEAVTKKIVCLLGSVPPQIIDISEISWAWYETAPGSFNYTCCWTFFAVVLSWDVLNHCFIEVNLAREFVCLSWCAFFETYICFQSIWWRYEMIKFTMIVISREPKTVDLLYLH